jgi:hypothetical protein
VAVFPGRPLRFGDTCPSRLVPNTWTRPVASILSPTKGHSQEQENATPLKASHGVRGVADHPPHLRKDWGLPLSAQRRTPGQQMVTLDHVPQRRHQEDEGNPPQRSFSRELRIIRPAKLNWINRVLSQPTFTVVEYDGLLVSGCWQEVRSNVIGVLSLVSRF